MDPAFADVLRLEWPDAEEWTLPRALMDALLPDGRRRYSGKRVIVGAVELGDLLFLKARRKLPADTLTARERVVAWHVAEGLTHKEIAQRLDIAPATVRNHIQAIHRRLDVHNSAELAIRLIAAGE
jgi:DNA-binding NarL/FixJ family response regulator